jgi:microcystin-dependent protein
MPLESATYISGLNSANPAHTDPIAQGDAHSRLIKATLKNTFPNFTAAALSSTQSAIDAAVAAVTGGTVTVGAGSAASPSLSVNGQGGLYSPGAHQVGIETNGTAALVVNSDQSVNFAGALVAASTVSAAGAYSGGTGQLIPTGTPLPWLTDTAPTGFLMANGQAVSRTAFAALFTVFGTAFGAGDGSSTFNLPNMQEVTLVGKSGMGGASSPGRITHLANRNVLGAVIGEEQHTLTLAEAPTGQFTFNDVTHTHTASTNANQAATGQQAPVSGGPTYPNFGTGATVTVNASLTGCSITDQAGGGAHNNVQPSFVVNYIIKT